MSNFLWLLLLCSLIPLGCLCIDCQVYSEYICGNLCLDQASMCHCGKEKGNHWNFDGYHCCINDNKDACYKDQSGDVFCREGFKQLWNETCNDKCVQMATWGFDTHKCQSQNNCSMVVNMCRGQNFCNDDYNICSKAFVALDCESQFGHEGCGLLENAKWVNYGCKHANYDAFTRDHFECANRMDKMNIMFKNLPVYPSPILATAVNYNQVLRFNDTHIICGGTQDFKYEEFYEVQLWNGTDKCELKNGRKVQMKGLWGDLSLDFSFNMSSKIDEYL